MVRTKQGRPGKARKIGRGGPSLEQAGSRQPRVVARRKRRMRPGAWVISLCAFR